MIENLFRTGYKRKRPSITNVNGTKVTTYTEKEIRGYSFPLSIRQIDEYNRVGLEKSDRFYCLFEEDLQDGDIIYDTISGATFRDLLIKNIANLNRYFIVDCKRDK